MRAVSMRCVYNYDYLKYYHRKAIPLIPQASPPEMRCFSCLSLATEKSRWTKVRSSTRTIVNNSSFDKSSFLIVRHSMQDHLLFILKNQTIALSLDVQPKYLVELVDQLIEVIDRSGSGKSFTFQIFISEFHCEAIIIFK